MQSFGELVRSARIKKGLTVQSFIKRLERQISPSYVVKIEIKNHIPQPLLSCKIAEVLDIDMHTLLEAAKRQKRAELEKRLAKYQPTHSPSVPV